jgi:zinc transport system substrate-binding protein
MHGAYDYMMQEFGLTVAAVIEPRHGVEPTARQLAQTIDRIKAANVNVLFAEAYFSSRLADTIEQATGVHVYSFSHIDAGPYTPERFEEEMRKNLDTLAEAIEATIAPG